MSLSTKILHNLKTNLSINSKWSEVNGAMGDLGTYIPIILALTLSKNLDLGTTLIFTGVYNMITGAVYGLPMPVQPMKAIAAVAISSKGDFEFGVPEIMSSGICTSVIVLILGLTGVMKIVYRLIPLPVVRGVQLSQGLSFCFTAVKYIRHNQDFSDSKSGTDRPWLGFDGLVLAISCSCFIILTTGSSTEIRQEIGENETEHLRRKGWMRLKDWIPSIPSAFIVFLLGAILAILKQPSIVQEIKFGPSSLQLVKITKEAWKRGFIRGTVPQLPLTILNSVIAVCKLSSDLFETRNDISVTSISVTVGTMNLIGCWFGAMPCCHGAGGLAGQYRFGGRSGACVFILGIVKLALGVAFGSSIVRILERFPVGILGVLLLFAGVELGVAVRDMGLKEDSFVMILCASISLVGSSAALGFVCGVLVHLLLRLKIALVVGS